MGRAFTADEPLKDDRLWREFNEMPAVRLTLQKALARLLRAGKLPHSK
jgi:uncharacterized membrane protein